MAALGQVPLEQEPVVPVQEVQPSTPIPSTTPELEQILVKIQELEQRIGDCELQLANGNGEEGEAKYEKLRASIKKEDIKGTPEVEKDKKKEPSGPENTDEVPQAQTSEIDEGSGEKSGASVAGEETGLDKGEPSEKDAEKKVPKPSAEYPKMAISRNALDDESRTSPKGEPFIKKKYSEEPEEMEDKEGKKMPSNKGFEENYNYIKQKLSGRKSMVGVTGDSNVLKDSFLNTKEGTSETIKEYLKRAKVRI